MPYIKQEERDKIDNKLREFLMWLGPMSSGQFVYILYKMMQWQASDAGTTNLPKDWQTGSRVMADLECAKLEFYRRTIGPYEDEKIVENGDCDPFKTYGD